MARTALTVLETSRTSNGLDLGGSLVAFDQANGMEVNNSAQNVMIYIYNGDASGKTLTITTSYTSDGLALADLTATIAAGERRIFGAFSNGTYGSGSSSNLLYLDIDSGTSVTIAAFKMGAR